MKRKSRRQQHADASGPFDLSTQGGVTQATNALLTAVEKTGAAPDYGVYLLMRAAQRISECLLAHGEPDTFELALRAVNNPPPSRETDQGLN